jgi:hypothetical protein
MLNRYKDVGVTGSKSQSNPEYMFFESLRGVFEIPVYQTLIKLLHLYNEVRGRSLIV